MNDSHPENQVEESTHYLELMGELGGFSRARGAYDHIFVWRRLS